MLTPKPAPFLHPPPPDFRPWGKRVAALTTPADHDERRRTRAANRERAEQFAAQAAQRGQVEIEAIDAELLRLDREDLVNARTRRQLHARRRVLVDAAAQHLPPPPLSRLDHPPPPLSGFAPRS